jgi:hypothetical protein
MGAEEEQQQQQQEEERMIGPQPPPPAAGDADSSDAEDYAEGAYGLRSLIMFDCDL